MIRCHAAFRPPQSATSSYVAPRDRNLSGLHSPCGSGAAFGSSLCFRESDARGRPQGVECHRLVRGDTAEEVLHVDVLGTAQGRLYDFMED